MFERNVRLWTCALIVKKKKEKRENKYKVKKKRIKIIKANIEKLDLQIGKTNPAIDVLIRIPWYIRFLYFQEEAAKHRVILNYVQAKWMASAGHLFVLINTCTTITATDYRLFTKTT